MVGKVVAGGFRGGSDEERVCGMRGGVMSGNGEELVKKISCKKGLKSVLRGLGRKLFRKVHKNEVEYGQTLSKKRRKKCILKSVSSLGCAGEENGYVVHSPYEINFKFSKEDGNLRSSVFNFQKIDVGESCCEKCFCTSQKGDALSRFSISSDSACDVSSESSCDDEECRYRNPVPKPVRRVKQKRSEKKHKVVERTLENFIRAHKENFKSETMRTAGENDNLERKLSEWLEEEPRYESLVAKAEEVNGDEPGYDILVTKANCSVIEPSYENLKLIQTVYAAPTGMGANESFLEGDSNEKSREVVQSSKTYDEVIESLKLWHLNLRNPECSYCCEKVDNQMNHYVEGYESLENDFNNDIEEFCC